MPLLSLSFHRWGGAGGLLALLPIALLLGAAPASRVVREQRVVRIGGQAETWRLVWNGAPRESRSCGPADPEGAMTCPCDGVAFAQVGDLMLERERPGAAPERMRLAPLFTGSDMLYGEHGAVAMLPRWPGRLADIEHPPTPAAIHARRAPSILRLRDYDHDGIAGEFLLQVDTQPCGKHVTVAVGVTRARPRLHALTSAEHPERPLRLYAWQWDALARRADPGRVADWPCGDHGAEQETTVALRADHGRLHATRITSTCPWTTDATGHDHHDPHFRARVLKREML